jgi:hypothetical protein
MVHASRILPDLGKLGVPSKERPAVEVVDKQRPQELAALWWSLSQSGVPVLLGGAIGGVGLVVHGPDLCSPASVSLPSAQEGLTKVNAAAVRAESSRASIRVANVFAERCVEATASTS